MITKPKKSKLVYGWGINDADYRIGITNKVNGKSVFVWRCPYYTKWVDILKRCHDPKEQARNPTYIGCTVCEEWKYLSNFIKWVDSQPNRDWQNCEPDKDLLINGNKIYSPATVVFITKNLNGFLTTSLNNRGEFMLGVYYHKRDQAYRAQCNNPMSDSKSDGRHIGNFKTEIEAHKAWQAKKHKYACQLADLQEDNRVAKALRERYAPDKDWTDR